MLTLNDLSALNRHLHCIAQKWRALGFQLGFTPEMVAALVPTGEGNYDPAVYLSKVLSTWLQQANPPATLEALCRALSHTTVGEEKLARSLYGRFNHSHNLNLTTVYFHQHNLLLSTYKFEL